MSDRPLVAIIAEVGHRVGWGHVSRCVILQRILSSENSVTLKVVNREPWDDASLAREFALLEPIYADIVFADGLELREELDEKVDAASVVSLSYMSDINGKANLVVAPALHGMDVPGHFVTDLDSLLCNQPRTVDIPALQPDQPLTIGIAMGGADVEGLTPALEVALKELGYRTKTLTSGAGRRRTLSLFLEDKLRECQKDPFPYYAFSDCDIAVCQGGLSAIELALLGIPTVIRSRSDFTIAYGFLESLGCSLRSSGAGMAELLEAVSLLCEDADRRSEMVGSCLALGAQIREPFWTMLVEKLVKKKVSHEAMPFLWGE